MAKAREVYICGECGYETSKWLGKCPSCGQWNTISEESYEKVSVAPTAAVRRSGTPKPMGLKMIQTSEDRRVPTQISELDRVLSGGIVQGSLVLIGGDPGIGKSTLLLQICQQIGESGHELLYVSGEESTAQIKIRAERLSITTDNLLVASETNIRAVENMAKEYKPAVIIIDSIQTMYNDELTSAPGSVTQVRECTGLLMRLGKGLGISIIIVGHVTKDGAIAGPRVLEHMVDTVLYFEGDRQASYRILRAVKNRFGSTNEIGVFEMCDSGLRCIENPSEFMIAGRPQGVSGSVITSCMEGTRPILAEVQSLACHTSFGMPRRMATGMDYNRVVLLIAVLEKRVGYQLSSHDIYVNLAGGIKINEPALDAAVLVAIGSSYRNMPVAPEVAVFGEVGLTGEVRAVSMAESRVMEAYKLGFGRVVLPYNNLKKIKRINGVEYLGVRNVNELLDATI